MEAGFIEHLASNSYFDPTFGTEAIKVLPGEYFVTTTDMLLVTVLGSCVSACIRDKERGIGGLNHFMLADSGDLEAKVFGGGRVMAALSSSNVGERNSTFVLNFLRTEGIAVSARDLLDVHPRKVYFFPATGRVLVKKLTRLHNDTLLRRESAYAARLTEAPISGEIELF